MTDSAEDYDDYEDEEVSYESSETSSFDPVADLLDRYSVGIRPDYCLKLRKTIKTVVLGSNTCFGPSGFFTTYNLKPKHRLGPKILYKIAMSPRHHGIMCSSNKLNLLPRKDWLKLQLNARYDWRSKTKQIFFNIATKWNASMREVKRKEQLRFEDSIIGRLHWSMQMNFPEVRGSFGDSQAAEGHAEPGMCHLRVERLVLRTNLDYPLPYLDREANWFGRRTEVVRPEHLQLQHQSDWSRAEVLHSSADTSPCGRGEAANVRSTDRSRGKLWPGALMGGQSCGLCGAHEQPQLVWPHWLRQPFPWLHGQPETGTG